METMKSTLGGLENLPAIFLDLDSIKLLPTFAPASFGFSLGEQAASSSSETPDRSTDQKDQWENPTDVGSCATPCKVLCFPGVCFKMNRKMCYLLQMLVKLQINPSSEPLVNSMPEQLELSNNSIIPTNIQLSNSRLQTLKLQAHSSWPRPISPSTAETS